MIITTKYSYAQFNRYIDRTLKKNSTLKKYKDEMCVFSLNQVLSKDTHYFMNHFYLLRIFYVKKI
jgi:hypothetical protein